MLDRDIYYRDPELFIKQTVVNRYVDDIAYTLGVDRDALNIVNLPEFCPKYLLTISQVAAAKGLVAGSFSITRKDNSVVDYSTEPEGILIPNSKEIESTLLDDVQWILVIEKEVRPSPSRSH